jgi:hypothetical protein
VEERANDLQHYATELQSVTARLAGYAAALRHGGNEPHQLLTVELPATAAAAAAAAALAGASAASKAASPASSFNLRVRRVGLEAGVFFFHPCLPTHVRWGPSNQTHTYFAAAPCAVRSWLIPHT